MKNLLVSNDYINLILPKTKPITPILIIQINSSIKRKEKKQSFREKKKPSWKLFGTNWIIIE